MVADGATRGQRVRILESRSRADGLHSRAARVGSAVSRRIGKAATANRGLSKWSESDAATDIASADRALWRKDARVQGYTISLPGQTRMRSSCAIWFPGPGIGRKGRP
jgi:hypothetical protein